MLQDEWMEQAEKATNLLKKLSNKNRLMILCLLIEQEELTVQEINQYIPLSQSALSQHLAKLREDDLVSIKKVAQFCHYRIANKDIYTIIHALKEVYCPAGDSTGD